MNISVGIMNISLGTPYEAAIKRIIEKGYMPETRQK